MKVPQKTDMSELLLPATGPPKGRFEYSTNPASHRSGYGVASFSSYLADRY